MRCCHCGSNRDKRSCAIRSVIYHGAGHLQQKYTTPRTRGKRTSLVDVAGCTALDGNLCPSIESQD